MVVMITVANVIIAAIIKINITVRAVGGRMLRREKKAHGHSP